MRFLIRYSVFIAFIVSLSTVSATTIDFTGGTVHFNGGGTATTDTTTNYENVSYYEEDGFKVEFLFGAAPTPFASNVGDYYGTGNDVFHAHWIDNGSQPTGPYGEVSEIKISKIDGTVFDLGGFRVTTNTACGGCAANGGEITWVNSSKGSNLFTVDPDDWGLGNGTDPLITVLPGNTFFDDILWFSFTNDSLSTAVGLGLDNFFLDEPGDPNGNDPTNLPEPATFALLGLGLFGLGFSRRKKI